ncbi:MAG: pyruvate dehydrogenase complex E1 component subunit beta [Alphaproteobacteria bacterium]|nr:pyruvate dehydrogenase complex E1 component subunit beta [Alphaproteobacteria bacterium]MDA8004595.1 pyruvate dehydrogenase complex E1 component subunit beta [Alphaproteobacteria bacterium]MDA8006325.1 pyruvate dehydrogenase complex E1 component subunit beta [Alphaproteobacteria bacterium]MDA8013659.1 pyruvate dehydrogenase complex E1 component subunit beta [Alphaproteobacteria bacterium]
MAHTLQMPALSPTMSEGVVAKWCKNQGENFSAGELLAEIETDKAVMELEAAEDGVLARLLVNAGDPPVAVGAPIALILEEGEDPAALEKVQIQTDTAEVPAPPAATTTPPPSSSPSPSPSSPAPAPSVGAIEVPPAAPQEPEWSGSTKTQTTREALRDAMAEEMRRDENVFLIGEEVGEYQGPYKVSVDLLQEFGERRVVDTPITEHGFAGLAIGAAFYGLRPIVEFMTFNFAMQAMDQIINSAAKTHYMSGGQVAAPVVFRGPNGAAARVAAQHSQCYASWYAHVPGLVVLAPGTAASAKGLLKSAIRSDDPVIFLENEILYAHSDPVPEDEDFTLPVGRARVIRPGSDVTLTAFSLMIHRAMEAADELAKIGISAEVIDLRSLRPLDRETIVASVKRTSRLVSVEEGWGVAGIGAELSALACEGAFDWLDAPPARVSGADVPLPYAANLEALALPQVADIIARVRALLNR